VITGALILAVGILAGWLLRSLSGRRKGPESVEALCGCTHHHSFHDPKSGQCHSLMRVPGTVSKDSHHAPCTCKQYSGPLPLPEYFAPEIVGEAGQ
jgi:hypothetical protein